MTSKITFDNISIRNNPAPFLDNIQLQITFTANEAIEGVLDWKIIYVGSAKNEQFDQILEQFQIDAIHQESTMMFTVDCSPPDYTKIPKDQLICVTAIIITVSYNSQQFIRVGYYVHNVLTETIAEQVRASANLDTLIQHTKRTILVDKPRITKFKINWGDEPSKEDTNNSHLVDSKIHSNTSLLGSGNTNQGAQHFEKQFLIDNNEQNSTIPREYERTFTSKCEVAQ